MKKVSMCLLIGFLFWCCSNNVPKHHEPDSPENHTSPPLNQNESHNESHNDNVIIHSQNEETESENKDNEKEDNNESDDDEVSSKLSDGTHWATVEYNNPEPGYSATYTLQVEVEDKQIVRIDFPNGGYLDDDHISPADLEDDGTANVEGEDGKTYDVTIND